jgi:hypothetical protein
MDLLILALIIIAVVALSGWGYGTYVSRPAAAPAPGTVVEAPAAWVNPIGLIGALAVVGVIIMLATGWRPFVIVQ